MATYSKKLYVAMRILIHWLHQQTLDINWKSKQGEWVLKKPSQENVEDECDLFCRSMALKMKKLPPLLQMEFQQEMLRKMTELTVRQHDSQVRYPTTPTHLDIIIVIIGIMLTFCHHRLSPQVIPINRTWPVCFVYFFKNKCVPLYICACFHFIQFYFMLCEV